MINFSAFNFTIFCCVLLSFPLFYGLGIFFTPPFNHPWQNISARLIIGALIFILINALLHAGIHTMLFPLLLWLPFLFQSKPQGAWCDIKAISFSQWALALALILLVLLSEMWGNNLIEDNFIIVGNWDIAHTSGLGNEFFQTGSETTRFLYDFKKNRVFYHFPDLWFSGFYSTYFDVLPYYAYAIIYRSIYIVLLLLVLGLMTNTISEKYKWASYVFPFLIIMMPGIMLFNLGGFQLLDRLWSTSPYFVAASLFLLSSLYWYNNKIKISLLLIASTTIIHPMLSLSVSLAFLVLTIAAILDKKIKLLKNVNSHFLNGKFLGLMFLFSTISLLYAKIDGRMYSMESSFFSIENIKTNVLVSLLSGYSLMYVFPFLIGLHIISSHAKWSGFAHFQKVLLICMLIVFIISFPIVRGEAEQISIIFYLLGLLPIGIIGLLYGVIEKKNNWGIASRFMLLLISVSALLGTSIYIQSFSPTQVVRHLRWSDDDWRSRSKIHLNEAQLLYKKLGRKNLNNIAFATCNSGDDNFNEHIFLARFPYLKAFIPGIEIHRISVDTSNIYQNLEDEHKIQLFKKSTLNHFYQHSNNNDSFQKEILKYLQPKYLLLDTQDQYLCIPSFLNTQILQKDTLGRFILVSLPPL